MGWFGVREKGDSEKDDDVERAGFRTARHRTSDGLELSYRDYAPASAAASRTPVLCLHGLTRNARDFEEFAPLVAGLGRRVIVPEQRGRAGSDRDPDPARYLPATYAADMLGLLDALELSRVVAVGSSMGGIMSMIMALARPGVFAGVVLNDVGPEIAAVGLTRIQGYVGDVTPAGSWEEAAANVRAAHSVAFPRQIDDAAFWDRFARRLHREEAPGRIVLDYDPAISANVRGGDAAPPDMWPLFEALGQTPTLVVRGEISDILTADIVTRMQAAKPDLIVAEAADVGHAPFLTEADVWPKLAAFLSGLD